MNTFRSNTVDDKKVYSSLLYSTAKNLAFPIGNFVPVEVSLPDLTKIIRLADPPIQNPSVKLTNQQKIAIQSQRQT
jgi:hypothetical protein